jgi:molybdopterin molybdotransferase
MLLALLARWGMEPVDLGHARDAEAAVAAALDRGASEAAAILTTGGASAGDEDHVSRLIRARGRLETWRIAMKPGRPLALGLWRGVPVFGLPGNPVAAFVCALIFARPALALMAGAGWAEPEALVLPAAFAKAKKPGRREYLRARLTPAGTVEVFASEGSGRISGLAWARGLVELGDAAAEIAPGDPVRYLPFSGFGL